MSLLTTTCPATCEVCHGKGYIEHEDGIEICPNDPRKYYDTGVELEDKSIPGLLKKTNALTAIQSAMSELIKAGYGMVYLQGDYGIGKTVFAKSFTVDAVIGYGSALYRRQSELVNYLRASYDNEHGQSEYKHRLDRFKGVKWLVIDEVGRDRLTDFGVESMAELIDARYQGALKKQLMTVLISNKAPEDVFEAYVVDRIRDTKMRMLVLKSKSQRSVR
jgi:DNA replication protein DnaC